MYMVTVQGRYTCQNLGAASSNRVRTSQDTIDVDCCVRKIRDERRDEERDEQRDKQRDEQRNEERNEERDEGA